MDQRQMDFHPIFLGSKMGVDVIYSPNPPRLSNMPFDAWAEIDKVVIEGMPPSEIRYFVALHELGHIVNNHCIGQEREAWYDLNNLEGEAEAWNWALDTAHESPSLKTIQFAEGTYGLQSYEKQPFHQAGMPGNSYRKIKERFALAPFMN